MARHKVECRQLLRSRRGNVETDLQARKLRQLLARLLGRSRLLACSPRHFSLRSTDYLRRAPTKRPSDSFKRVDSRGTFTPFYETDEIGVEIGQLGKLLLCQPSSRTLSANHSAQCF